MVVSALNRKLLRDLWKMRGQAFAIAMVVAAGVSLYVTYLANYHSLRQTQAAYYERQRFGDVFASLKRAPLTLGDDIRAIADVSAVELRVVAEVVLDLPAVDAPAHGRLVSVPAERRPLVNDLYLRKGRWIEPGAVDEVMVSEGFAIAHGLEPSDTITAIINGARRTLTIVGVAISPEYIYVIRPAELVPDDRRFGIFWMDYRSLAAAFDMEGGFNDVTLSLARGATPAAVIDVLDRRLERYGGLGALPRELQLSHWTLQSELRQLESMGLILPMIFLLVAAFVLNVALTRALTLQRPQIASLKALGYSNAALAWHYIKWAMLVSLAGLAIGISAGVWLGGIVGDLYNEYFRFPNLHFILPASTVLGAAAMTLGAAVAGAYAAVMRAVRVPPAEAMRPEPPARYRRSFLESSRVSDQLSIVTHMVIRNLSRHPMRAATSIAGIAAAVGLLMVGRVMTDAMQHLIDVQFWTNQRQDAAVSFLEPRSARVRHELRHLPGVLAVEPYRAVPARIRAGHRYRYLSVIGVDPAAKLHRIVDGDGRVMAPPPHGVVLSRMLADRLAVETGDAVTLEPLEGTRRSQTVMVSGLVDDVIGLSVYMDHRALHALMREGETISIALLIADPLRQQQLSRELKEMPGVAGVTFKRAVLQTFRDTMAATMDTTILINLIFAGIIAVGVVYNAARVALSERSHELASLRVLGYTRGEISLILLSELAVLTVAALPAGWLFGYGLAWVIFGLVQSEVYRFPMYVSIAAVAWTSLAILAASALSGLIVRRRLDRLDLIAVLKVRE
jgi:putative ABC transport system permease protein